MTDTAREEYVEAIRQRFAEFMASSGAAPETQQWVSYLFGRGQRIADELEARFGCLVGKTVLEVGTAYGGDLVSLYARGAHCVGSDKFCFDYARLREFVQGNGQLQFVRCDAMTGWPFPDKSFDFVLAMEVLELVQDLDAFFAEVTRVLKPGGAAFLETPVALRMVRRDPIYGLPVIGLLPNRIRRWVAERVFHRGSAFRISNHTIYSAYKFARYARKNGYRIVPVKFAGSPLMARVSRWPIARFWQYLVRYFAFDFMLVVPRGLCGATEHPGEVDTPRNAMCPDTVTAG